MTVRQKYQQALTDLAAALAGLAQAQADLAVAHLSDVAKDAEIADLRAQVADLQALVTSLRAQVDELEHPRLPAGGDIQAALSALDPGATLKLAPYGVYNATRPFSFKDGQTIVGPAFIVGVGMTSQQDLLAIRPAEGVQLIDLDVSGAGRHGVTPWFRTVVAGGRLHHNGKDGIGADFEGWDDLEHLVDGVEIDQNGTDPYWNGDDPATGNNAGGIKWYHGSGMIVRRSNIHDNAGNAVWGDAQCGDMLVEDNTIKGNRRKGVFYEKGGESDGSFGGAGIRYTGKLIVRRNTIQDNDTDNEPQANAGVCIYTSKNAEAYENIFGGNGHAIAVREDSGRLAAHDHGWPVSNIAIGVNELNGDDYFIQASLVGSVGTPGA